MVLRILDLTGIEHGPFVANICMGISYVVKHQGNMNGESSSSSRGQARMAA